jgi:hypothetical protein
MFMTESFPMSSSLDAGKYLILVAEIEMAGRLELAWSVAAQA